MPPRPLAPGAALLCLAALAAAAPAEAGDCQGFDGFHGRSDLFPARVTGTAQRVPFVKGSSEAAGCPSAADRCRSPSYLVPGDAVLAGAAQGGYSCVDFVDPKGDEHAGFVPAAAVTPEAQAAAGPADWLGDWVHTEAAIAVGQAPGGRLKFHGDATWGSFDPDRVKRGGVNVGEFDAVAAPDGGRVAFDVGDQATLPVDKGGEFDCKLWLRRLGPFLLVDDNRNCGGMNVTFGGVYRRKG